jgi:hypothetical protein
MGDDAETTLKQLLPCHYKTRQSAFREEARYAYMDPAEFSGIMFECLERKPKYETH